MVRASAGAADNLEEIVRCAVREELEQLETEIVSQSPN